MRASRTKNYLLEDDLLKSRIENNNLRNELRECECAKRSGCTCNDKKVTTVVHTPPVTQREVVIQQPVTQTVQTVETFPVQTVQTVQERTPVLVQPSVRSTAYSVEQPPIIHPSIVTEPVRTETVLPTTFVQQPVVYHTPTITQSRVAFPPAQMRYSSLPHTTTTVVPPTVPTVVTTPSVYTTPLKATHLRNDLSTASHY